MEVVRLVNSDDHQWEDEGAIVDDIKLLSHDYGTSKICFQPRECNKVACELARIMVKP